MAPASALPEDLEEFLKDVELDAKRAGFNPTLVLYAQFDTAPRREFARRLAMSVRVNDARLKDVSLPLPEMVWDLDPIQGSCRITPEEGVILVVTDERRCETCFGFLRYPEQVIDMNGKVLAETNVGPGWFFTDHVKSPDPRFRRIIARFREHGFVVEEQDDFASK
jgi:hypothetical protein